MKFDKYEKLGAYHHDWYQTEPWYKEIIDFALDNLEGKRVLDIGCGDGVFLKLAAEQGFYCTGIDSDATAVELSRTIVPQADVHLVGINSNSINLLGMFDTMVCINTVEHLENPAVLTKIFREQIITKMIIITDYPRKNKGRYHVREYSPHELVKCLQFAITPFTPWPRVITELNHFYALQVWK